ncbi:hypothetical protein [Salinispora tropica]|uniref:hypothetical protein n=1 Tax=Salinispora tropica TaxID=168695 RepID=UPI001E49E457|nr:hypothetical protein [Salinispora tropica]
MSRAYAEVDAAGGEAEQVVAVTEPFLVGRVQEAVPDVQVGGGEQTDGPQSVDPSGDAYVGAVTVGYGGPLLILLVAGSPVLTVVVVTAGFLLMRGAGGPRRVSWWLRCRSCSPAATGDAFCRPVGYPAGPA